MALNKAEFAHLIPHAGAMCLLDRVREYTSVHLHAETSAHRSADNPLRREGHLSPATGIEFAAQAMALHGALTAGEPAPVRRGYIALVRDIHWRIDRLDTIVDDLDVRVRLVVSQRDSAMYEFSLEAGGRMLVEGRTALFFSTSDAE